MLQAYIQQILCSNLERDSDYPDCGFSYFSSTPSGKFRDSISIKPQPLPPKTVQIHHLSVILPFDAIQYRLRDCHEITNEEKALW
jgi:hypothetical protein